MSKIFDALQGTRSETADLLSTLVDGEPDDELQARTLVPAAPATASPRPVPLEPAPAKPPAPAVAAPAAAPRPVAVEPAPAKPAAASPRPAIVPAASPQIRRVKLAIPATVPVLPFENQNKQAAEQYRIARTKITHHPKHPKTIGVTSPGTGDGKTVTAINLAGVLSLKASAKILLVDVDFRRSSIHALLGLPKSPGLAEVIEGICSFEEAAVEAEEYPNLNILTSGESKVNPTELLESPRWHAICERWRAEYEFVILDTPPVGVVADWDLIQLASDGIVLVFRPDHTKRGSCSKVIEAMPKEKLIGVVLNQAKPFLLGGHGGGYGYGYGYGYGPVYGNPPVQENGRPAKPAASHRSNGA